MALNYRSRVVRALLATCILMVPASVNIAGADPVDTPSDHAEWLDRLFKADISGPMSFTAVSAGGGSHTCGLRVDQRIVCWGNNDYGQSTVPVGRYTAVAVGVIHSCGVKVDQSIACWGDNYWGQSTVPGGAFTAVSAGEHFTCGLQVDQGITCWGFSGSGFEVAPGGAFTAVSVGYMYACGVKVDQTIVCWGDYGEVSQLNPPPGAYTAVSVGFMHSCGLKVDQNIACWGESSDLPPVTHAGTFTAVSAGHYVSCGLTVGQTITCFNERDTSVVTESEDTFTAMSIGYGHNCGVKADRSVACEGNNASGQATSPEFAPGTISDAGIEQYVTDLETDLATRTSERDDLSVAPVCELKVPTALGTKARVSLNKALSGTVRWVSPASKANVGVQITRVVGGETEYWVTGTTWSSSPTTKSVTSGTTYAGTTEAPWKLVFPMPATVGVTYRVSCSATDTAGNTSATPDLGKLISIL